MKSNRECLNPAHGADLAAGGLALSTLGARAEDAWPSRSVRLISPYGPGGSNDTSLRILAERLEHRFNQRFIVENRSGAGNADRQRSRRACPPDGYTFLYAAAPYATAEAVYGKLNYDPRKDLKPISLAVIAPVCLIVNAEAPYKTLQEFIAYAKGLPNGVTFASPGAGSGPFRRRAAVPRGRYQGPQCRVSRRLHGLHRVARRTRRCDADGDHGCAPAYPRRQAACAGCSVEGANLALSGSAHAGRTGLSESHRLRLVRFHGADGHAGRDRQNVRGSGEQGARRTRRQREDLIQGLEPRGTSGAEFGKFIEDETAKWTPIIRDAGLQVKP